MKVSIKIPCKNIGKSVKIQHRASIKCKKNRKNSEKYFQKFGKILVRPKKKKKKKRSSLKFGEKIRKNTENSEKYLKKFGKILKILKNRKNSEKYQKIRRNTKKFGKI